MADKLKGEEFISIIDKDKVVVKYLWRIVVMLSVAIVILSFAFMSIRETTRVNIELPATLIYKNAPVVVAGIDGANKVYYRMWGEYVIKELSNFTYETIGKKVQLLKKMMRPTRFVEKKKEIDIFTNTLSKNLMSQKFIPEDTNLSNVIESKGIIRSATITVNGIAFQSISKEKSKKECKYDVDLRYVKGVLYVEDFGTDCF
ncbi:TraE/TraK family type IV conjugative transfer system protein [Sulfurimonas indica]|uniref:TraE/TraK family type IV conjugative transfer system protein n=1 Tax=Sulfurimonas TaxID=202746 RepID=UPI001263565D|nr:TraE/TraK family type IV conjugative transfer system protein [Sulfurimonas indica]